MTTLIGFFIVLSVLVLVHEAGHFVVAKRAGVKVEEFGLGFPPRLFSFKKDETVYSFNLIPFGGFVKMLGEDESEVKEKGSFGSLTIGKRAQILVAGVVMNFILAVILLTIVSGLGRPAIIDNSNEAIARDVGLQILQVMPDSPADEAGLLNGDKIISVTVAQENIPLIEVEPFQEIVANNKGGEITVIVNRQGKEIPIAINPRLEVPEGEGPIGISLAKVGIVSTSWWKAPWEGLLISLNITGAIVIFVWQLVSGGVSLNSLAGPIGIASLTGDAIRLGLVYVLQFTALLSINLAILNILPFPALDGGRILFLLIEKIKGSPVNRKIESTVNLVGFILLLVLMVIVTFQDIGRFL